MSKPIKNYAAIMTVIEYFLKRKKGHQNILRPEQGTQHRNWFRFEKALNQGRLSLS